MHYVIERDDVRHKERIRTCGQHANVSYQIFHIREVKEKEDYQGEMIISVVSYAREKYPCGCKLVFTDPRRISPWASLSAK